MITPSEMLPIKYRLLCSCSAEEYCLRIIINRMDMFIENNDDYDDYIMKDIKWDYLNPDILNSLDFLKEIDTTSQIKNLDEMMT